MENTEQAETTENAPVETIETTEQTAESGANADTANNTEFTDGEKQGETEPRQETETPTPHDDSKSWKTPENAESARRRREQEQQEAIAKARREAIIEAVGGINPYTQEQMTDETDIREYLAMKELEKQGKDPITDYASFIKNDQRKQQQALAEQKSREEFLTKDRNDFAVKYPNVKVDEVFKDELFTNFANGKLGKVPLVEIYENYNRLVSGYEEKARTRVTQILANAESSTGRLSQNETDNAFYTREQVKEMTQDEVRKNYDKIRTSMKKW
jgi:hypothetical protein